ncbi:hypothetical protein [Umezawaea sp. Da 62-37]|uniref:hypothetical protein n=1 Tax=Umezawaea sp. Da 62-37 TaxID=3075927 RepID=UPI0028F6D007|nr:hypothetical protein [Umezawaea sp. Da 62-37]WNV90440.1 hypothetical protein RM788_19795 [Umezawaea sp. Da 62-37]
MQQQPPPPGQAADALAEIRQRQGQIIERALIPTWFWWAIGLLVAGFSAAVETDNGLALGIGTTVFVLGNCAAVGAMAIRGRRHARPRNTLLGGTGVLMILGFTLGVLLVTMLVSFSLNALGTPHAATLGGVACAVLMIGGGPFLTRRLRTMMVDRVAKGSR